MNYSTDPPHNEFPGQHDQNAGQQNTAGFQSNAGGVLASESSRAGSHAKFGVSEGEIVEDRNGAKRKATLEAEKLEYVNKRNRTQRTKHSGNASQKRGKRTAIESGDGSDTDSREHCSRGMKVVRHQRNRNQVALIHQISEKEEHLDEEIGCSDDFPKKNDPQALSVISQADGKAEHLGAERTTVGDDVENPSCSPLASPVVGNHSDTEFHTFERDNSEEKFHVGQIWALYSEEHDGMPKYNARINEVKLADFEVHVTWLKGCLSTQDEILWSNQDLPITCGTFELGETAIYDSIQTFSHLVQAKPPSWKNIYDIYPKTGEVWVLYKDWRITLKRNCEYGMVEVVADSGSLWEVLVLGMVDGFKTVSKGVGTAISIPQHELLRFSHQVPAFMLTDEGSGKLRGCWEIDPAAMPVSLFCSDEERGCSDDFPKKKILEQFRSYFRLMGKLSI